MKSNNAKNWWLYGNDQVLAHELQKKQIESEINTRKVARLVSDLTYIGDHRGCERLIMDKGLERFVQGRQALCRARRGLEKKKTWESLCGNQEIEETIELINNIMRKRDQICIALVGGIGDQIEAASMILGDIKREKEKNKNILIRPNGENKCVVRDYLKSSKAGFIVAKEQQRQLPTISVPMYMLWRERYQFIERGYRSLGHRELKSTRQKKVLVCYRSKIDKNNILSSFCRSIPFRRIMEEIEYWEEMRKRSGVKLIDIGEYTPKEKKILRRIGPNIRLARGEIRNLKDTVNLMNECKWIISVDTSLGHLAAAEERDINILLPISPDERWHELMKYTGTYQQHAKIYKQIKYNDWEEPLSKIRDKIERELGT